MENKFSRRKGIYEKTNGRCWYCGITLTINANAGSYGVKIPRSNFTIDHVIPISNGGKDNNSNLVPSCNYCNGQKKDRSLEDFRELLTRLSNHAPKFTDEQVFYLQENGIELPDLTPFIFYFKKEGLTS